MSARLQAGLTIRPCSYADAKTAVQRWHYSRSLPAAPVRRFGVYEGGRFRGVVLFGFGANPNIGRPYGLPQGQVCELVRVALAGGRHHRTTEVVAACLHRLKAELPAIRLVISYADVAAGHVGKLYQAGNWAYLGPTPPQRRLLVDGRPVHPRSLYQRHHTSAPARLRAEHGLNIEVAVGQIKHRYGFAFDAQMRRRLRRLSQPYPHAVKESEATRPSATREGPDRSRLTAPNVSPVSCGRRRDPTRITGRTSAEEGLAKTRRSSAVRKNVAVKVEQDVHSQLAILAQLQSTETEVVTIPDVIRLAVDEYVERKRAELSERAAEIEAEIEREAAVKRAAMQSLLGPNGAGGKPSDSDQAAKRQAGRRPTEPAA